VDHFSDMSFVHLVKDMTVESTIKAREAFVRFCGQHGVKLSHMHADNGRFADATFVASVQQDGHTITFAGVGAHHQNGRAEKRIRDLQDMARTMMVFAQEKWPSQHHPSLWPYALTYANDIFCHTPRAKDGVIPFAAFKGVSITPAVNDFHTWGQPCFVLRPDFQGPVKPPKWEKRAYTGIFLGRSPSHASSVAMVLNIDTAMVTPQYHVAFDELFETVQDEKATASLPRWASLSNISETFGTPGRYLPLEFHPVPPEEGDPVIALRPPGDTTAELSSEEDLHLTSPSFFNTASPTLDAMVCELEVMTTPSISLYAFAASSNPDILTYAEAMRAPDRAEFLKAMEEEINNHHTKGNWKLIRRQDLPSGARVLPAVWAMR